MMKNIGKLIALLVTVIMSASLAACGIGGGIIDNNGDDNGGGDDRTINILYEGWINGSVPSDYENNPYKKLIDETFDVDYKLSLTSDFKAEIGKRYSTNNSAKPDVIIFRDYMQLKSLYNQGWYVQDYTPWLEYVPNLKEYYQTNRTKIASLWEGDNLTCLSQVHPNTYWSWKIRKDWVEDYGRMPQTADDLLDMARWVKTAYGSDYYLFTAAGENKNLGYLGYLQYMFGEYNDWYVDAGGNVNHPILDGTRKQMLDYVKIIEQENLADPNWYTQSWGNHKTKIYNGHVGMAWYPAVIAQEYLSGNGNDESKASGIWQFMPMPTSQAGVVRQGATKNNFSTFIAINADVEKNETKMKKILKIINDTMFTPTNDIENSLYYQLRWGLNIDGYTLGDGPENEFTEVKDANGDGTGFYAYFVKKNASSHKKTAYGSLWDYGTILENLGDKVIEYVNSSSYGQSALDFIEMYNDTQAYYAKQTKTNYTEAVSLNSRIVSTTTMISNEFEINYIKGRETDFDAYKNEWLNAGGSTLKQSVEAQLRALGVIG
jgi:putative aldouronate transport system substrate-binding protein